MPEGKSFFDAAFIEVLAKTVVGIALAIQFWSRNYLAARLMRTWRYIARLLSRTPYVVVWTDLGIGITGLLSRSIAQALPGVRVKALKETRMIERFPILPWATKAYVLIVADVTKLSDNERVRKRYQQRLVKYVLKGGGLFGGHDLIYRRTRNEQLQEMFGGRIFDFRRTHKAVKYVMREEHALHAICKVLSAEFSLDDGEIIRGEWAKDVMVLYDSGRPMKTPLVTAREYGRGRVVWSNSADAGVDPPRSIAKPDADYVKLVVASVRWFMS